MATSCAECCLLAIIDVFQKFRTEFCYEQKSGVIVAVVLLISNRRLDGQGLECSALQPDVARRYVRERGNGPREDCVIVHICQYLRRLPSKLLQFCMSDTRIAFATL